MPAASVLPVPTSRPRQSDTRTTAPATGVPLSSVVTQAKAFSRPNLKCTAKLVTNAEVRTYMVRPAPWRASSSEAPSFCDAISTT